MQPTGFGSDPSGDIRDMTPDEVQDALAAGTVVLVDVREPHEFEMAHIQGSQSLPLSAFDARAIAVEDGQGVVYLCAAGIRSRTAILQARAQGVAADAHLAGGLKAWHAAGLPLVRG